MRLPKIAVFHDNKAETATLSQHINSRLPVAFQKLGICRHYHSDMSPEYLEEVYNSFSDEDGNTLILNATSGAREVGILSFFVSVIGSEVFKGPRRTRN
jgi:hypothetical protein